MRDLNEQHLLALRISIWSRMGKSMEMIMGELDEWDAEGISGEEKAPMH